MQKWRVVGWMDDAEWEAVCCNLYHGDKVQIRSALDQIKIWRARFAGRIPVAVEATAQLFECLIFEGENDSIERQSMATALSQFVGLLTERSLKGRVHSAPIHVRAEMLGIPEWLTNLRHESAHGLLPPSLILRKGVNFALDWLKTFHWDEQFRVQRENREQHPKENVNIKTDEKIVNFLRRCVVSLAKQMPPEKYSMDQLTSIINFHPTAASLLAQILIDNNFISLDKNNSSAFLYIKKSGVNLSLSEHAEKFFKRILTLLAEYNALSGFLLRIMHEMRFAFVSIEICLLWINTVLNVISTNPKTRSDVDWYSTIREMMEVKVPLAILKKALLTSNLETSIIEPVTNFYMHMDQSKEETSFNSTSDDNLKKKLIRDKLCETDANIGGQLSHETTNLVTKGCENHTKSWTLFQGDLSDCPIGLMPGQYKSDLWQALANHTLKNVQELGLNPNYGDEEFELSAEDLCVMSRKIDLL